jgi:tetratricopeptide (TPR) repeat protein
MTRPNRSLAPLVVAAALALGGLAQAQSPTAKDHYTRGMAAYALEDWDAAIAEFQAGFRDDPLPAFLYNVAQAHRKAKRPEQAVKFYRKYLELAPEDAKDRGDVEALIATLQHAIDEQQRALVAPPTGVERPATQPLAAPPPDQPAAVDTAAHKPLQGEPPRRDVVAFSLVGAAAALVVAGIGMAVYSSYANAQAVDQSTHLDLEEREALERRSYGLGVAGYSALGVGVLLGIGAGIRFALRPRVVKHRLTWNLGGGPQGAFATVGGSF